MSKICLYCGDPIDMDDYRCYTIVQHEDETSITVFIHTNCIDMNTDDWMIKTLESYSRFKEKKEIEQYKETEQ